MLAIGMPGMTEWMIIFFTLAVPIIGIIVLVRVLRRSSHPMEQRGFEVRTQDDKAN